MNTRFLLPVLSFFFIAFLAVSVFGHDEGPALPRAEPVDYLPFDPEVLAIWVFAFVLVLSIFSIIFLNSLSERVKKVVFLLVALPVVVATVYMAGSTVYLNLISESEGPIHWHADYEIWVCQEHITNLKKAVFPSNKVGSAVFHHHDDFRMHVEGLVIRLSDVNLRQFFRVLGGDFTGERMRLELDSASLDPYTLQYLWKPAGMFIEQDNKTFLDVENGQKCADGKPGKWRLYLKNFETGQFEENAELEHYIIKPYFTIPPGDFFKLVFDSKEGVPNVG